MAPLSSWIAIISFLGILTPFVLTDTPANCTFDDIQGTWIFSETERNGVNSIDCFSNSKNSSINI